jgi:hypothetical protein
MIFDLIFGRCIIMDSRMQFEFHCVNLIDMSKLEIIGTRAE